VRGYGAASYGDGMADVYDSWYAGMEGTDECVAALVELAEGGPVLELGIGTGRLALPLADAGLEVHGVDASAPMLAQLEAKRGGRAVHAHLGDMAGPLPPGPFPLVFVAYNTFFNLTDVDAKRRCLAAVAGVLAPGGRFVLEAFVPDEEAGPSQEVEVRAIDADRVVLFVSGHDPARREVRSQFVELTEAGGVRLRPTFLQYASPAELDEMAAGADLALAARWGAWDRRRFDTQSEVHVSVYQALRGDR
jgi:SAM-dependent methyltransferase